MFEIRRHSVYQSGGANMNLQQSFVFVFKKSVLLLKESAVLTKSHKPRSYVDIEYFWVKTCDCSLRTDKWTDRKVKSLRFFMPFGVLPSFLSSDRPIHYIQNVFTHLS